jgi:hypothetical protein
VLLPGKYVEAPSIGLAIQIQKCLNLKIYITSPENNRKINFIKPRDLHTYPFNNLRMASARVSTALVYTQSN